MGWHVESAAWTLKSSFSPKGQHRLSSNQELNVERSGLDYLFKTLLSKELIQAKTVSPVSVGQGMMYALRRAESFFLRLTNKYLINNVFYKQ